MPRPNKQRAHLKKARTIQAELHAAVVLSSTDTVDIHLNALNKEEPTNVENLALTNEEQDLHKHNGYPGGEAASNELNPELDTEPYEKDSNDEEERMRMLAELTKDTQILWGDHLRAPRQNSEASTGRKRGTYYGNAVRTKRRRRAECKEDEKRGQTTLDLHFSRVCTTFVQS